MKKFITFLVLVVVVVLVVMATKDSKVEEVESLVVEENAVVLGDQRADDSVTVHYVKLSNPGYVSVYKTDLGGNKTILGTSELLSAGEHRNVKVRVGGGRSAVAQNDKLVAELNVDDGDGVFGEGDQLVVDEVTGEVVDAEAMVDENAPEEVDLDMEAEADGYTLSEDAMEDSGEAMDDQEGESVVEDDTEGMEEADEEGDAMEQSDGADGDVMDSGSDSVEDDSTTTEGN